MHCNVSFVLMVRGQITPMCAFSRFMICQEDVEQWRIREIVVCKCCPFPLLKGIDQHLLDNAQCALHYHNDKFSILAQGRFSFHLSALEATFIKSLNPLLSKQKEFVYSLKIS